MGLPPAVTARPGPALSLRGRRRGACSVRAVRGGKSALPAARPAPGGAGGPRPGRCPHPRPVLRLPGRSHGGREELPVRLVRQEEADAGLRDPRRRRPEPSDLSLRGAGPAACTAPLGRAGGSGAYPGVRGLPGPRRSGEPVPGEPVPGEVGRCTATAPRLLVRGAKCTGGSVRGRQPRALLASAKEWVFTERDVCVCSACVTLLVPQIVGKGCCMPPS